MKKPQTKLGFSASSKELALRELGFSLMEYSGKIAEAPANMRHVVRELTSGIYLINSNDRAIVKQMDLHATGHKFVYDKTSLLNEQFREAIFYVLQTDYLYVFKTDEGRFEFSGVLSESVERKNQAFTELGLVKYPSGYYGLQYRYGKVDFISEPYRTFEGLLLDLAAYSPVSPFKKYASQLTTSQFSYLELVITKFEFSGDAVITLGPAMNGKMVATVVNYPEIDGIERLFAQAPTMLNFLLDIASQPVTASNIHTLKQEALRIIGEIRS